MDFEQIKFRAGQTFRVNRFWVYLLAGLVVLVLLFIAFDKFSSWRVHSREAEMTKEIEAIRASAATEKAKADAAASRVGALEIELTNLGAQLEASRAALNEAVTRTAETKVIYVKSKTNPTPGVELSGDLTIDRSRLCAEFARLGHPCKE